MGGPARRAGTPGPLACKSYRAALVLLVAAAGCTGAAGDGGDGAPAPDSAAAAGRVSAGPAGDTAACVPAGAGITGEGVGEIRVGGAVAALRERCAARDTALTLGEGQAEQALAVDAPGAPVIALHTGGDRVTRVIVSAPGPTTAAGIGVGSTIGDVRRAYPRACVLVGEGRLVVAVAELPGLSLGTTADFASLVGDAGGPSLAALPDSARVSSLWAFGAVGSDGGVCP